ncbi:MAG: response regulator [Hasllibacter sp.]
MPLADRLRVVAVDDMATSRGVLVQTLERLGVRRVSAVASASEAIDRIAADDAHLVLCDRVMPGMGGLDLLRHLRGQPSTRGIGFILVSGRLDAETVENGRGLGLNNILPKPFGPDELRRAVEAVVGPL